MLRSSQQAAYLTHSPRRATDGLEPEFSRRGRGFATYAAIRQLGAAGVAEMMERYCEHAHALVMRMGSLPGSGDALGADYQPGAGAFSRRGAGEGPRCFYGAGDGGDTGHGRGVFLRDNLARAAGDAGERQSNWQTSAEDVERVVRCVAGVLESLRGDPPPPLFCAKIFIRYELDADLGCKCRI